MRFDDHALELAHTLGDGRIICRRNGAPIEEAAAVVELDLSWLRDSFTGVPARYRAGTSSGNQWGRNLAGRGFLSLARRRRMGDG